MTCPNRNHEIITGRLCQECDADPYPGLHLAELTAWRAYADSFRLFGALWPEKNEDRPGEGTKRALAGETNARLRSEWAAAWRRLHT